MLNQDYGKATLIEAVVFIISNCAAGGFNFWLANGEISVLRNDREDDATARVFAAIVIPYFILTEFVPCIVFARTIKIFGNVMEPEQEEDEQVEQELNNQREVARREQARAP